MDKIIKYSDYELNEGVREFMTPKNPQEAIKNILENPKGFRYSNAVNALEVIKEGGLLEFMTDEDNLKIAEMAKDDFERKRDTTAGQKKNIVWFMNRYGGGKWFINTDTGKSSEIDGSDSRWAAKMLKEIL